MQWKLVVVLGAGASESGPRRRPARPEACMCVKIATVLDVYVTLDPGAKKSGQDSLKSKFSVKISVLPLRGAVPDLRITLERNPNFVRRASQSPYVLHSETATPSMARERPTKTRTAKSQHIAHRTREWFGVSETVTSEPAAYTT